MDLPAADALEQAMAELNPSLVYGYFESALNRALSHMGVRTRLLFR